MNKADKIRVLITGVGGGAVGHQVLHALSLMPERYDVIAVDADAYSFGLYKVTERYLVPLARDPKYIPAIETLIREKNVRVLIPGTEAELKVLAEQRTRLESHGCFVMVNPGSVISLCGDKLELYHWLKARGYATPETATEANWRSLVAEKGFPLVGKPAANSSGSRNVAILQNEREVERYIDSCGNLGVVFQEYIDAPTDEYTVGICVDATGRVIDSIVLRRNLTGITLGGKRVAGNRVFTLSTGYSQGFIVSHPEVQAVSERLVAEIGIRGPSNIQCRYASGKVYVFEVHPRFSGTTSLRADVGFNEPDILIRSLVFGEQNGRQSYKTDVAVIRAFQSVVVPLDEMNHVARIN